MSQPRTIQSSRCTARCRNGFTLLEAMACTVIVSVMLAAALQTVATARLTQYKLTERSRAVEVGRALMSEILAQAYIDPGNTPVFGPEAGETRATYEDVDDYNGLTEDRAKWRDGTAMPGLTTWRRNVEVSWVDPNNLSQVANTDTGAKRVRVSVFHNNVKVLSLTAVKSAAP